MVQILIDTAAKLGGGFFYIRQLPNVDCLGLIDLDACLFYGVHNIGHNFL
jgi:hypothetical protein